MVMCFRLCFQPFMETPWKHHGVRHTLGLSSVAVSVAIPSNICFCFCCCNSTNPATGIFWGYYLLLFLLLFPATDDFRHTGILWGYHLLLFLLLFPATDDVRHTLGLTYRLGDRITIFFPKKKLLYMLLLLFLWVLSTLLRFHIM